MQHLLVLTPSLAVAADCCVRSPFPGSSRGSPGPQGSLRWRSYTSVGVPCPFSPVQFSIEVVYSQSGGDKTWAVFLAGSPSSPNLPGSGEGWGRSLRGQGIPGDQWPDPLAGSSPVVQAERLVVVSSFSTWAKVVSFSWSGRHCLSASRALHQNKPTRGDQTNKPTLGDRKEPFS